ncbi:MAG: hypothetical protein CTY20_01630 [Hyphomicrobium sp.]|nr:MAG: hypothetical protein CTY20_01630 [Hyphomicrobium sp.]
MFGEWMRPVRAMLGRWLGGDRTAEGSHRASSAAVEEVAPGPGPQWGTLSGLTAHPTDPHRLYAVTDQDSPPLRIIELDVSQFPAQAVGQTLVVAPGLDGLDFEGIVATPDDGFWLASEGGAGDVPPNLLIEVDGGGQMLRSIGLPQSLASKVQKKGFEGIAREETAAGTRLHVAFQGPLAGDPEDVTRIGTVDLATGVWSFSYYPLERLHTGDNTGLSEMVSLGGSRFAVIERDGKGGRKAVKWVATVSLADNGAPAGSPPRWLKKTIAMDLVPLFTREGRKVAKEIEGLAVAADGQVYAITDNDREGATLLLRLGRAEALFGP